ncbi:MAG TPA: HD domain-containing phosphohydrolase [Chthonomonadales bacterium]|nr:HD domain-containing phosphohydrolase [Chthonomonadales bacterium]
MRTIRSRVILLLLALAVGLSTTMAVWGALATRHAEWLAEGLRSQRIGFVTRLIDLRGEPARQMVADLAASDDLLGLVQSPRSGSIGRRPPPAWHAMDALWVFDAGGRLVHGATTAGATRPLAPGSWKDLLRAVSEASVASFYAGGPQQLLEVHGAAIRRSDGEIVGAVFAGRDWTKQAIEELERLTDGEVRLLPPAEAARLVAGMHTSNGQFGHALELPGANRRPVAAALFTTAYPAIHALREACNRSMALVVVSLVLLLGLLLVCLVRWVSVPLRCIARCLRRGDVSHLDRLTDDRTEYGDIARLVREFFRQREDLRAARDELEERVRERTLELAEANHALKLQVARQQRADVRIRTLNASLASAYEATIEGWARALDLRDHETEGHCRRVTDMTVRLARAMGFGEEDLAHVRTGALLHDIGKMGVPDSILLKPGPLTAEEWQVVRKHPVLAYELLSPIGFLRPAIAIPYLHHERWDGCGYPLGLAGKQIPLAARIFAVADVWDALRSDRPYRERWPEERVREHIRSLAGTHFDPAVVEVFLRLAEPDSRVEEEPQRLAA